MAGPVARSEIASRIGLTAGATSRIARSLIEAGLVRELPGSWGGLKVRPGRRVLPLDIEPKGGQVLGIDIGPTLQTVTLADIKNSIIASTELEFATIESPDAVVRHAARECRRLIGAHLGDRRRLLGGLVLITGPVEPVRGAVLEAPYLGWGAFPVRARFAEFLDLPIVVRPMTAMIARAEHLFGRTRGRRSVLTLLCGLGIGAAVILDGRLMEGGGMPTGGIGSMKVVGEDGTTATLDDLASGLGALRRLHGAGMTPARVSRSQMGQALREAIERDLAGDPTVRALMESAGRELGRTVVQFARFIRLETVLIAGPLSQSPGYMSATKESIEEGLAPNTVEVVSGAKTGRTGGLSASCAMAIWEFLLERPLDLSRLGARPG